MIDDLDQVNANVPLFQRYGRVPGPRRILDAAQLPDIRF